jgi:hypothetical protein
MLSLLAMGLFGASGNTWWRTKLLRSGFELGATIEAADCDAAMTQFSQLRKRHFTQPETKNQHELTHNPAGADGDSVSQLEKLGRLREKGLLTEEEFTAAKKKILG